MSDTNVLTTLGEFREDELRALARDTKPGMIILNRMTVPAGGWNIPYVCVSGQELVAILDAALGQSEEARLAVKALLRLLAGQGIDLTEWPPTNAGLTEIEWAVIRRLSGEPA